MTFVSRNCFSLCSVKTEGFGLQIFFHEYSRYRMLFCKVAINVYKSTIFESHRLNFRSPFMERDFVLRPKKSSPCFFAIPPGNPDVNRFSFCSTYFHITLDNVIQSHFTPFLPILAGLITQGLSVRFLHVSQ